MSDESEVPPVAPKPALSGVKGAAVTTAQVFRNPGAFLDWRAWGLGLWSNTITPFALSITSWLGTNGVEGAFPAVGWLKGVGMDWKTALLQAAVMAFVGAMKYVSQTKGLPPGVSNSPFSFKKTEQSPDP